MKTFNKTLFLIILGTISQFIGYAQNNGQPIIIPLSDPSKPGLLDINLLTGTMHVVGYSGKDVIISVSTDQKKYDSESFGEDDKKTDGLKRIPNNSVGLTAKEENNTIRVNSSNLNKSVDLNIQVPKSFNLKLSGVNDGNIEVENVTGELEINHVNGSITLLNISGSALASTTNGDVKVSFVSLTENTPMAFSSFNGDVDITFPAALKALVKMKSDQGEIYTDFEMNIRKISPNIESKKETGEYKISMDEWVIGDINGGGPEMTFKTFNGDIIIRKK